MRNVKTKKKLNIPVLVLIAILLIGIILSIIAISGSSKAPQMQYSFGKNVANGIDVSEHNGNIDWSEVSKSKDFAFIRVGYRGYSNGKIVEDKNARENLENAEKAGIPVGVYFYSQAVNEKEAQKEADFVYSIIKKYTVELPIIIDFEYPVDESGNLTGRLVEANNNSSKNAEIINAFTSEIAKKGYIAGVYASSSVLANDINTKKLNNDTVIWVADYNSKVTYNISYNIWQYSKTGNCDGVESKYVDLNYWYEK